MIELRNRRVLVVGLARTGKAVAQRLRRDGAVVTATDLRPPSSFGLDLKELMANGIGFELGLHREETFTRQDLIVVSPGVPWDLPQLEAARRRKVMIVPEVEAANWFLSGTLVGVTGTNGKTTTTTVLGKMLEASEFAVIVGGNIGVPLISASDLFSPESIVVAELSSFQLEAIRDFRPHVAVLLNITANHLDRHRTFSAYVSAKAQIFRNQGPEDFAVLNADDAVVMSLAPAIASRKVFFSLEQDLPEGVLLSHGRIVYRVGHLERLLLEEREIKLRGMFNVQNIMAAAAAACVLGADFTAIRKVAREFTGVEHRLEFVKTVGGVDFYNDSKATSVDAAAKALSTFDRNVHLILGGKDKGAPYTPLRPLLEGRVKSVYLIGSAAARIAEDLAGAELYQAGDLATAVLMAFGRAVAGDVVLLAPACASYDQFTDFEQRGQAFKDLVNQLGTYISVPAARPRRPSPDLKRSEAASGEPQKAIHSLEPERDEEARSSRSDYVSPAAASPEPVYVYEIDSIEAPPANDPEESSMLGEEYFRPAESPGIVEANDEAISPYERIAAAPGGPVARDPANGSPTEELELDGRKRVEAKPRHEA